MRIVDFGMTLGAADDRLDAGDQLAAVERLGQEVVGAEAEALDLVIELDETGQDEDRGAHPRGAQPAQNLVPVDVRQQEVENDDVVIVELADLQAVFAEIGRVADEIFLAQHQLDAGGRRGIVLNQQYAHGNASGETGRRGAAVLVNQYYRKRLTKDYFLHLSRHLAVEGELA